MHSTRPRAVLVVSRSASQQDISDPNKHEPATINTAHFRHSSSDLLTSADSSHSISPINYGVSPEMLVSARRSMRVSGGISPPLPSRPLPSAPLSPPPSPKPISSVNVLKKPVSSPPIPPRSLSTSNIELTGREASPLSPTTNKPSRRPLPAPPTPPKPHLSRIATSPEISLSPSPLPARPPISPNLSASPSTPKEATQEIPPYLGQEAKKELKHFSNPEPAVTMKDGVCQRHLSAPSSVLSESQLSTSNNNGNEIDSDDDFVVVEKSDSGDGNSRDSLKFSNDPTLRSWVLKKNSTHESPKLPKVRPEYRTHRKMLPEMVEVTPKNKVIRELVATESTYVDDLFVTIKIFMEPIRRYKTLSEADISAMFSNIEELYEINKALLASLVQLIPQINELHEDTSHIPLIPDIFLRHLPKLSGYTTYLCNKELSARVVKKVDNLTHFNSLMSQCRDNPECNGLGLGDYLIKPVQRLCKYPLILKELRKHVLPGDPQLPVLVEVINQIENLTEDTNKTISNTEKLNEIKKIMGEEVTPLLEGTTAIRNGVLMIVTRKKKEEAFFWLLDKIILWHPTRATLRKVVKAKSKNQTALALASVTSVCEEEYEHHKHSFSLKYQP